MKIFFILLLFTAFGNAQTPILSLYDDDYGNVSGAYYKDIDNYFNDYVGTWLFTDGNSSFKIVLIKKEMFAHNIGNKFLFRDFLVGEYQYIENGVEKINTLSEISIATNPFNHNIVGNAFAPSKGQRLYTMFSEPGREIPGMEQEMIFRRVDEDGVQKLKLVFRMTSGYYLENGQEPEYTSYTVPFGEYTLVKQQ